MTKFFCCVLIFLFFSPTVLAYPQDELKACMSSAKQNESIKNFSEASIEEYCNCALELIVDQNKDTQLSGYQCAKKAFQ